MSLQKIVDSGNDEFIKWIIEEFDPDTSALFLHGVCKNYDTATLKILVERVSDVDRFLHGETAFHVSIRLRCKQCSYILFDYVDKNLATDTGESPLHLAVAQYNIGLLHALLSNRDVNVNVQNANGDTALHYCCRYDDSMPLAFLLSHPNIKTNIRNKNDMTPRDVAFSNNSRECFALLQE